MEPSPLPPAVDSAAYNRLQQQLVGVRARLDRQVNQLIRLNQLSNQLLEPIAGQSLGEQFAEAVVDVLDVAIGAVWLFSKDHHTAQVAVCGASVDTDQWCAVGTDLVQHLMSAGIHHTVPLDAAWQSRLPGQNLVDPIVCPCVGAQDEVHALILASNSDRIAGMSEPTADETVEIFTLIAEKLAAHCDALAVRRLTEEQMLLVRESERRLALVLKGTNDGWWDWDLITDLCFVSERWLEMLGVAQTSEMLDGFWIDRVHDDDLPAFEQHLREALATAPGMETEVRLRRKDGAYLPVLIRATITRDDAGNPLRFTGSILDLTERQRQEQQILRLAFYDPLTDLPNRRLLMQRIEESLMRNAQTGQYCAVLMLDLDRFKGLNDTHGHAAGDDLLVAAARRLQTVMHGVGLVARLSGDEFIVLLSTSWPLASDAQAHALAAAENLQNAFREPFLLDVGTVYQSTSIGIALTARNSEVDTILHQADVAMYAAKTSGRNSIRVFEQRLQTLVEETARFESSLKQAFQNGELSLQYQPQVDENGVLEGSEALLRWFPQGGTQVPTERIIASAEDSGLIYEMGLWILETACRQARKWRSNADCRVAVNLGAGEFLHPQFPQRVLSVLDATGVPGNAIRLEITEATVVSDLEFAAAHMHTLRSHGVEFSLDDFGTGYSSLTYLRRLPLSEVKLDRSYISHLPDSWQDVAIVEAVVKLCTTLGFRVVAEGVETYEQLDVLRSFGCKIFQGHLIGEPQRPPVDPQDLVTPFVTHT